MATPLDASNITPGFVNTVLDAQRCFRAALWALSRPGMLQELLELPVSPPPLGPAAAALALTLIDKDAPVWLGASVDAAPVRAFLRFHCGTNAVETPGAAAFALAEAGDLEGFAALNPGHEEYPERAATLILGIDGFEGGTPLLVEGPGVDEELGIAPLGLPGWFEPAWAVNNGLYPLGIDVFLTAGNTVMGLPRSVKLKRA